MRQGEVREDFFVKCRYKIVNFNAQTIAPRKYIHVHQIRKLCHRDEPISTNQLIDYKLSRSEKALQC